MKYGAITLATLLLGLSQLTAAADPARSAARSSAQDVSGKRGLYVPPANLPRLREETLVQSGATRGGRSSEGLRVLAPDHTGLTVRAQPTLYWYTSRRVDVPVEVVLETASGRLVPPVLDERLEPPFEAGLHAISLETFGVTLETGQEYAWRVILVNDEEKRSEDTYAGANIRRVEEPETVRSAIDGAPLSGQPRIYASAGLWYDALDAIESLRRQVAENAAVIADCRDLLDSQSMQDVPCR